MRQISSTHIPSTGCCLVERHTSENGRQLHLNPRAAAARLLQQLQSGRSLSELLADRVEGCSERDQALVKALCFGVARWWQRLDMIAGVLLERPLKARDADIRALILIGLYQLEYMRVAPHAALAETVEAARALKKPWAAGLVNALLRRFQRQRKVLLVEADRSLVARYSHPEWLLQALRRAWPEQWQMLLEAANCPPPMTLRVNLAKISRSDYFQRLLQDRIPARPIEGVASAVVLDRPMDVAVLPGFFDGLVSVQDGGAQLAAGLLDLQPGQHVLDACAAPGGKTGHILESSPSGVSVTALDIDARRLQRVRDNLRRLGLAANVELGDAAHPSGAWAATRYDRILLDVPCSACGVIRRHPDIKLLRKAADIPVLAALQGQILDAMWPLLNPGGMLLYVTCSLLPEENHLQVRHFLATHADAREMPISATWGHVCHPGRQTLPGEATMDGFYYARLLKTEEQVTTSGLSQKNN